VGGINRMNAVLGVSDDCIAAHPSDMAVAMSALDARALKQLRLTAQPGRFRSTRSIVPPATPRILKPCWRRVN
jgi:hypothetical protein